MDNDKEYKGIAYGITSDKYAVLRVKMGKEYYFFSEKELKDAVDLQEKRRAEV